MIFLVQFGINKHLWIFNDHPTGSCTFVGLWKIYSSRAYLFQICLEFMWLPILTLVNWALSKVTASAQQIKGDRLIGVEFTASKRSDFLGFEKCPLNRGWPLKWPFKKDFTVRRLTSQDRMAFLTVSQNIPISIKWDIRLLPCFLFFD